MWENNKGREIVWIIPHIPNKGYQGLIILDQDIFDYLMSNHKIADYEWFLQLDGKSTAKVEISSGGSCGQYLSVKISYKGNFIVVFFYHNEYSQKAGYIEIIMNSKSKNLEFKKIKKEGFWSKICQNPFNLLHGLQAFLFVK